MPGCYDRQFHGERRSAVLASEGVGASASLIVEPEQLEGYSSAAMNAKSALRSPSDGQRGLLFRFSGKSRERTGARTEFQGKGLSD